MLGASLIILVLLTMIFRRDQAEYRAAEQELELVRSTLDANSGILSAVTEAETGERGFLLTGKEEYLKPYRDALTHLDADIARLQKLADRQPHVQGKVAELIPLVREKMAELKLSIIVRGQRGAGPALGLLNTNKGHELMNHLRVVSKAIETAEQARSREVYNKLTNWAARARLEISIGCVALFLLVAAGVFFTMRDMTRQQRLMMELSAGEERYRKLANELDARVRQRTQELEDSNRNIESFSYSVSHDLRAPLRAISGFSQMLAEQAGPRLNENEAELLNRTIAAAARMGELIDDLLRLSRTGRAPLERTDVSLTEMVRTIFTELRQRYPKRAVEAVVAEDLRASADPRLLRTALENLLDNAWKFTSRRANSRIEFGMHSNGIRREFFVRDNGAGFSMEHAANLFAPFQRLHSPSEFEGSGIGLATVHRIIQRHGGRIRAEAKPDEGATFYFTLGS
jgi:signal transduction histidine kinase